MTVDENVAILKLKADRAPVENKDRIEKLVDLYTARKIRDIRTVRSMVYALAGNEYRRYPNAVIERYEAMVASCAGGEPTPPAGNMPALVCPPLLRATPRPEAIERIPAVISVQTARFCMLASFVLGVSLSRPVILLFG